MSIAASLLPEFDQEMATTHRVLGSVPAAQFGFRPHPKSTTMVGLATHIANLPQWAVMTIEEDALDIAPGGVPMKPLDPAPTTADLLRQFEATSDAARQAIAGATDATLLGPWTLQKAGANVMTLPRIAVLRSFVLNHLIHHRAQLSLYFRCADLPAPPIYGPTAEEV